MTSSNKRNYSYYRHKTIDRENGSSTFCLEIKYALAKYWSDHNRVNNTTLKINFHP